MATVPPIIEIAKTRKKATVRFKVEPTVNDDLEALKKRVEGHGDAVNFNFDLVLEKELIKIIKSARKALDTMERSSTLTPESVPEQGSLEH